MAEVETITPVHTTTQYYPPLAVYTSAMDAKRKEKNQIAAAHNVTDHEVATSTEPPKKRTPRGKIATPRNRALNPTTNVCSSSSTDDSFTPSHLRSSSSMDYHTTSENYLTLRGSHSMDLGDHHHQVVNRTPFANHATVFRAAEQVSPSPFKQEMHAPSVANTLSAPLFPPAPLPPATIATSFGDINSNIRSGTASSSSCVPPHVISQPPGPNAVTYSYDGLMSAINSPEFSALLGQYPDLASVLATGVTLDHPPVGGEHGAFPPLPGQSALMQQAPSLVLPSSNLRVSVGEASTQQPVSFNKLNKVISNNAEQEARQQVSLAVPTPFATAEPVEPVVVVPPAADSSGYSSGYVLVSRSRDINPSNNKKPTKVVNSAIIGLTPVLNENGKRTYAGSKKVAEQRGFRAGTAVGVGVSSGVSQTGSTSSQLQPPGTTQNLSSDNHIISSSSSALPIN
eukprot:gene32584-40211_t